MYALSSVKRREREGLSPGKSLWLYKASGTFSAFSSSSVFPQARASGCNIQNKTQKDDVQQDMFLRLEIEINSFFVT